MKLLSKVLEHFLSGAWAALIVQWIYSFLANWIGLGNVLRGGKPGFEWYAVKVTHFVALAFVVVSSFVEGPASGIGSLAMITAFYAHKYWGPISEKVRVLYVRVARFFRKNPVVRTDGKGGESIDAQFRILPAPGGA